MKNHLPSNLIPTPVAQINQIDQNCVPSIEIGQSAFDKK